MDYESFIVERIAQLRQDKGVSARDMSMSIGQNQNYINQLENKKMMLSMPAFLYICEYLNITPKDFFDMGNNYPESLNTLVDNLKKLDAKALSHVAGIVEEIIAK